MDGFGAAERFVLGWADRLVDRRLWLLWAVGLAIGLGLLVAAPPYEKLHQYTTWNAVFDQAAHPFRVHTYGYGSHEGKLAYRLLVPVIGGRLGLDRAGFLILQGLAGLALIAAVALLCVRITGDRTVALFVAVATGSCWAGATAFVEVRGIFDGVALALLVGAALATRWPVVAGLVFLAGFTDERALVAALLVALFHLLSTPAGGTRRALGVIVGLVGYGVAREALHAAFGLRTGGGGVVLLNWWELGPEGAWTGIEGLWLFVLGGLVLLAAARMWRPAVVFAALVGTLLVAGTSVFDVTRSMAYLLPAAFVGIAVVRTHAPEHLRRVALLAMLASLLWPLYSVDHGDLTLFAPLPVQITRW